MLSKSKIKYIQSLGQKKFRREEGLFIAEGPKVVFELMNTPGIKVKAVFALREWMSEYPATSKETEFTEITEQELEKISQLSSANQVLALVERPVTNNVIKTKGVIVLALDGIRDPGNMGTIIRIADWFGIGDIVCSLDSAEVYNPKVVQSTMGSIARVQVHYRELGEWLLTIKDTRIYAAVLDGRDIGLMEKPEQGIILIGNESAGIDPSLLQLANIRIAIPQKGKAESLNAAVATGIILSHLC